MPEAATNPSPELPALPPAADLEARTVLKHCLAAHAALVELRLTAQRHSTAAMVAAKMRLEAQDSTAPPTHGRRDDHPGHDGAACHSALLRAVQSLSALALSARIAAAIAEAVTTGPCSRHCRAGAARPGSLCVGSLDPILAAWKRCLKAPSVLDPFVRAAVQHSHLLTRNPFGVASGPAGRIVNLLVLRQAGLIDAPSLNLNRYLRGSRGSYDRLLAGVTIRGEWQPWPVYVLRAMELAAAWSSERIRAIRALLDAFVIRGYPDLLASDERGFDRRRAACVAARPQGKVQAA